MRNAMVESTRTYQFIFSVTPYTAIIEHTVKDKLRPRRVHSLLRTLFSTVSDDRHLLGISIILENEKRTR